MESTNEIKPAEGVYAALATPRRKNLAEPDTAAFLDYLDTIVQSGVDGVVLFGATGEFVHFDISDRMHVLKMAIRRSRVPVLVNVSHSTLDGAVALAEDAVESGAAGILLMPPYFFRYDDEEIEQFFLQFAKDLSGRAPLYLYNLPVFTNRISSSVAKALLLSEAFSGIKDSSGDWTYFEDLIGLRAQRPFQLFVGNENIYTRGITEGANGIVSGLAAAFPELIIALYRAVRSNDAQLVSELDAHLRDLLTRIEQFPPTVGIKEAAAVRGWSFDQKAVPLGPLADTELLKYRDWLKDWIPAVIQECAGV